MKIIAHRGSSLLWPENTLLAFDLAHQAGASGFETDLRLSRDDEIVLSHDANLLRFGYAEKVIHKLSTEQIINTQISSIDKKFSANLITLKSLLRKYPEKDYIFDCKISDKRLFEILKEVLATLNFHNRIWFLTWSREADNYIRHLFPGYSYFPRATRTRIWAWSSIVRLANIFEPENKILSLPAYYLNRPVFTKNQIVDIHKRGKEFVGYLVNTVKDVKYCKACGVKIVLTDYPNLLSQLAD